MSLSQPVLVSVIIPTRNSQSSLSLCLESLRKQTYPSIEIIVVDNASQDETPALARNYTKQVYTYGPERTAQRNFGASKSKGKYLCFIDSDMVLEPTVIEECVGLAEAGIDHVVIPELSKAEGFWGKCRELEKRLYFGDPHVEASRFIRKSTFLKVGAYNETMVSGEDWELHTRLTHQSEAGRSPTPLYHLDGKVTLWKTSRKKFYYARKIAPFLNQQHFSLQQVSPLHRYWSFTQKIQEWWRTPHYFCGLLILKTAEYTAGACGIASWRIFH